MCSSGSYESDSPGMVYWKKYSVGCALSKEKIAMRFIRALKTLAGLLAVLFIGVTATLFIGLPRVANMLADLLGTGAEQIAHWWPLVPIWLILILVAIFWVWRPWRQYLYAQKAQGLVVQRGQGRAYMDTESVRQQVYAAVVKVPNVQRAEVTIHNDLGRAVVQMNVLVDNDINGPKKKQEISREVKKVVQDQLGVYLASEPIINLSLTPVGAEIPHAVPAAAPQVSQSPTSPRTLPAEPPRRAAVPPPPPPKSEPVKPITRVEPETTVIPEPPLKADEGKTVASEAATTETLVTGSRPFTRRPFTPPAGSSTLPDLPNIEDQPRPPAEKPPEDAPADPADEDSPAAQADNDKTDTLSAS